MENDPGVCLPKNESSYPFSKQVLDRIGYDESPKPEEALPNKQCGEIKREGPYDSNLQCNDLYQSPPSYYKRLLPSCCIPFNSCKGKQLFRASLNENNMESYFSLSMQFLTQSEPAFCGLGTLCMVLNALEIDPMRRWKGIWRWYDENMLDCCRSLDEIKEVGITVPEFVCIARCNRLNAISVHADDDKSKERFIQNIKITSKSPSKFMVVSYDRSTLGQTGTGHFSPIGGYCEQENAVLIMDVARFKYPAYWVSVDLLWKALQPIDPSTGKSRGYILLSKGKNGYSQCALSQLSCNKDSWHQLSHILFKTLPKQVRKLDNSSSIEAFLSLVISAIPDNYYAVVDDRMPLFVGSFQPGFNGNTEPDGPCSQTKTENTCCNDGGQNHNAEKDSKDPCKPEIHCQSFETDHFGDTLNTDKECSKHYIQGLNALLNQLSETKLYKLVASSIEANRKLNFIHEQSNSMDPLSPGSAVSPNWFMRNRQSLANTAQTMPSPLVYAQNMLGISGMESDERSTDTEDQIGHPNCSVDIPRNALSLTIPNLNSAHSLDSNRGQMDELPHSNGGSSGRPPNDFIAFLTMFLFALFSYSPSIYENIELNHGDDSFCDLLKENLTESKLPDHPSDRTIFSEKSLSDSNHQDSPSKAPSIPLNLIDHIRIIVGEAMSNNPAYHQLRIEIQFLKEQIAALTELVQND